MAGEATVGSIVGYLRMDDSDWKRTIDEAKAKADELGRMSPNIKVKVDSAEAKARMAEVEAAAKKVGGTEVELTAKFNGDRALTEIAKMRAQTMALAVSFDRAEHDASASIGRLSNSMSHGGNSFLKFRNAGVDAARSVSNNLSELGNNASASLKGLPAMTYLVAAGALLIGPAAGVAAAGLVGMAAAAGVAILAYKGFQDQIAKGSASGLAIKSQIDGISTAFHTLANAAASGASGGVLSSLQQVKSFLPTLQPLVANLAHQLGLALSTGTGGLIQGLKVMSPLMDDMGGYAQTLAQKFADFTASPDFKRFIDYARQELPKVGQDLADIGRSAITLATTLQPVGDALLSITTKAVNATAAVGTFLKSASSSTPQPKPSNPSTAGSIWHTVAGFLTTDTTGRGGAAGAKKRSAASNPAPAAPAAPVEPAIPIEHYTTALQQSAQQAGLTVSAYQQVTQSVQDNAASLAATTLQMQLQNDASGLLKQALDKLSGGNLSAAQAQNQFEQGLVNMVKHTTAADSAVVGLSSSAIKNRGDLLNLATNAGNAAEAYGKMTDANGNLLHGSEAARQKLIGMRKQLIDNAVATGENRAEVTKYIDSIMTIPPKASTTGVLKTTDAENILATYRKKLLALGITVTSYVVVSNSAANLAIAQTKAQLRALDGATATTYLNTVTSTNKQNSGSAGTGIGKADGGIVFGSGSGTSDSINARLSNGEFVVKASATAKHRAMLEAINNGYADGGIVTITPTAASVKAASKKAASAKAKAAKAPKVVNGSISATADGGAVYGIAGVIQSQVGQAANAMKYLSAAVNDAFKLDGVQDQIKVTQSQLANTKTALANLQTASNSLRSGVTSNLSGTVDPTKYTSISDLIGAYSSATANNQHFSASEHAASAKGANKSLLAQLVAAGNSAGLDTLANSSKGDIAMLNKQFLAYQGSANTGGLTASSDVYGAQIKADQARVVALTKQNAQQEARAAKLETVALSALAMVGKVTGRPAKLVIDGKELGHVVFASNEFQGVIDNLTHQLLFGRH
jgi:hypothetical protein